MLTDRSLTQAVSAHRDASSVVWVPRHEQSIKFVNLLGDGVHDGLTVGGTIVEEDVQQSLIGKVTQTSSAGQGDLLYPPANERKTHI